MSQELPGQSSSRSTPPLKHPSLWGRLSTRQHVLLMLAFFALIYLIASPFRFGEKGSGRYLLPVLQQLDGGLFPDDPTIVAMGHFGSLFYRAIGTSLAALDVPPENLEAIWQGLYLVARLGLVLVLFLLARRFGGLALALLLLAWGAHIKPTFVGGTAIFVPQLSHQQVAVLLYLIVLAFFLANDAWDMRKALTQGLCLGIALLIHPLVVGYGILVLLPMGWRALRNSWTIWPMVMILGVCGAIYLLLLSPPALTPAEAAAFLANKAGTGHVSLAGQPDYGWLKCFLLLSLASASRFLWLRKAPAAKLLQSGILIGVVGALALSVLAQLTDSVLLTRLQPLRAFLWIQFFAELLLLWSAIVAWQDRHRLASWLCVGLAFQALGSIWFLAWMAVALLLVLSEIFDLPFDLSAAVRRIEPVLPGILLVMILIFFLLDERQPFASARDVTGMWVAVASACLFWTDQFQADRSSGRRLRRFSGLALLVTVLACCSWRDHRAFAAKQDPAWRDIGQWAREHTAKEDRFLTRPGLPNFRFVAWRTSLTESLSALYWVDPSALEPTRENARRFTACRSEEGLWKASCLDVLARQVNGRYVLLDEPLSGSLEPVFTRGPYRIYQVFDPGAVP